MKALTLLLMIALCACSDAPSPPPATVTVPAAAPDPAFVGRVWVSTTPGSARGSIIVFLPDRTLLMDSCFETFRLSKWGVAGDRIRWLEDTIPIEASVSVRGKDELRLQIAGQDHEQSYVAASVPYVCPDMPR